MRAGLVTKIIKEKGCGFILIPKPRQTVYFRLADCEDSLRVNDTVVFDLEQTDSQVKAINIQKFEKWKKSLN